MGAGFRWAPLPRRLLEDERVLDMDLDYRALLMSIYAGCDKHGRFPCGPRSLARIAAVTVDETAMLPELARRGLVVLYVVEGVLYGELEGWATDAPSALARSSDDRFPNPDDGETREPSGPHPEFITMASRSHHARITMASSSRHDGIATASRYEYSPTEHPPETTRNDRPSLSHHDGITMASSSHRPLDETRRDERGTKVPRDARASDTRASSPEQPPDEDLPPIGNEGQAMLDEFARRASSGSWGAGTHSGGFFADDGLSDAEMLLRRLKRDDQESYLKLCRSFFVEMNKRFPKSPDKAFPKPAKALEEFMIDSWIKKSVLRQVMAKATGGGE